MAPPDVEPVAHAGPVEPFGSLAAYRRVAQQLVDSGAALDEGMLYFDARLAATHPTVEIRVADVTASPADAVVIAALVRALVETAVSGPGLDASGWRVELVRAAQCIVQVRRHGRPARPGRPPGSVQAGAVVERLNDTVHDALLGAGDVDLVHDGTTRLLRQGGAGLQRAALASGGGPEAVVDDLVHRMHLSCGSPGPP